MRITVNGRKLTIEIDIPVQPLRPSSTGKSDLYATASEKITVEGHELRLGLNLTQKR